MMSTPIIGRETMITPRRRSHSLDHYITTWWSFQAFHDEIGVQKHHHVANLQTKHAERIDCLPDDDGSWTWPSFVSPIRLLPYSDLSLPEAKFPRRACPKCLRILNLHCQKSEETGVHCKNNATVKFRDLLFYHFVAWQLESCDIQ